MNTDPAGARKCRHFGVRAWRPCMRDVRRCALTAEDEPHTTGKRGAGLAYRVCGGAGGTSRYRPRPRGTRAFGASVISASRPRAGESRIVIKCQCCLVLVRAAHGGPGRAFGVRQAFPRAGAKTRKGKCTIGRPRFARCTGLSTQRPVRRQWRCRESRFRRGSQWTGVRGGQ